MKSTPIFYVCLVLSIIFFILPGYGYAMKTHHGRVADPVTGAAVANAQVFVMGAGTMDLADVFADSQGKQPLANRQIRCLLYTSPSPRDKRQSRMPSSA